MAAVVVKPAIAYQALFAFLAALVALACLAYLRIPDAKPSAGFPGSPQTPRAPQASVPRRTGRDPTSSAHLVDDGGERLQ